MSVDLRGEDREFLLAPLREGRPREKSILLPGLTFLLAPLREGRPTAVGAKPKQEDFYSRPCVRGDSNFQQIRKAIC